MAKGLSPLRENYHLSLLHNTSFRPTCYVSNFVIRVLNPLPLYPTKCVHILVLAKGLIALNEDLRTVFQLFSPGMFVFSFDLNSAYHHIDICEEHMKFYEFKVLPFGLTSASYVFTKVMRQLVKFWRGCGLLALMYLDDGIGGNLSSESAKYISVQVRKDQIISMSCAVCNDTRLLARSCYAAIEQRASWDQLLFVSPEIRNELFFWQSNINSINGKPMSLKSSAVGVVYSDTSDSDFGGYFVQCGKGFTVRHLVRRGDANEFHFAGDLDCKICSFILA